MGVRTAVRGSTRLSRSEVGTSTPARSRCSDRRIPAETGPVSAGGFAEKFRMREKSRKIEILRRTFSDWIKELEGNEKFKSNERKKLMENFGKILIKNTPTGAILPLSSFRASDSKRGSILLD